MLTAVTLLLTLLPTVSVSCFQTSMSIYGILYDCHTSDRFHNYNYHYEINFNKINSSDKLVVIVLSDIPKITFRPKQTLTVNEGADAQLICINDGNVPNTTTVWKSQDKSTVITQNDKLKFIRIQRTDAGLYTCRVESKAGVYEDNAKIVVQCK